MNFKEIKEKFNNLKLSNLKDIDSKDKVSGIYCIYIDGLEINNLIPLYVGQSKNIYSRINQHKRNIKSLLELSTKEYNNSITSNTGKYFYCKIVSTLINNDKKYDDIKFKILETCIIDNLDQKEQEYIEFFNTAMFGFNQFEEIVKINTFLQYTANAYSNEMVIMFREIEKNLSNVYNKIKKFNKNHIKYGYYLINYHLLVGSFNLLVRYIKHSDFFIYDSRINAIINNTKELIEKNDCLEPSLNYLIDCFSINKEYCGTSFDTTSLEYRKQEFEKKINNDDILVLEYISYEKPIKLKCKVCDYEWNRKYDSIIKNPKCPNCNPSMTKIINEKRAKRKKLTDEEKIEQRKQYFYSNLDKKSNGKISCDNYIHSKEKVTAKCKVCGHEWSLRADKLLYKPYCSKCKNNKIVK